MFGLIASGFAAGNSSGVLAAAGTCTGSASGWRSIFCADFWRVLLSSEFNRGYFAALAIILLFLLVLLVVRIFFALIFGTRGCKAVEVRQENGEFTVSVDALETAARRELDEFEGLAVRRIRLYRRGRSYTMAIYCSFNAGISCAETAEKMRPKLLAMFKSAFGIETIKSIRITVEKLLSRGDSGGKPTEETEIPSESATFNYTGV